MKAVILAGGFGTRISEETHLKPKPMIEIGGKPLLWHIMKIYSAHGINEFVICCGYKGYMIKEYFANYFLHMSDVTFDIKNNKMEVHRKFAESLYHQRNKCETIFSVIKRKFGSEVSSYKNIMKEKELLYRVLVYNCHRMTMISALLWMIFRQPTNMSVFI
jgi:NDP-sugar pyrophosphorylase family protein